MGDDCSVVEFIPEGWGALRNNWFGSCSGQGTCVVANETAFCQCNEGWTGNADFFDFQENCQINLEATQIIWIVGLVLYNINFILGMPKALLRIRQYKESKEQKERMGQKYSIRQNRGLMAILLVYLLIFPSLNALAVIKLVDPDQHLGSSLPLSIAFLTGKIGFYSAVYVFQPALLGSLLQGSKSKTRAQLKALLKKSEAFSLFICGSSILLGALPLVTYAISDGRDTAALVIYYCYMYGMIVALICLGSWAAYVRTKIIKVLDQSYSMTKSERTLEMKKALVNVQNENIKQCIVQGVIFSMFAFLPSFYGVHDYFLPINVLAYAILGKKVCFTTISDGNDGSKSSSSSREEGSFGSSSKSKELSFTTYHETSVAPPQSTVQTFQDNVVSFHEEPTFDDEEEDSNYV